MSCPKCNPQPKSGNVKFTAIKRKSRAMQTTAPTNVEGRLSETSVLNRERLLHDTTNVVLVGNPNVGKSSLFNDLTGLHQSVINAPGTTVEIFSGFNRNLGIRLIDTPGTYSLIPNSPDEAVAVETLAGVPGSLTDAGLQDGGVDLVVVILDATALSRSLYLLAQVGQTGLPVAVVLSMQDVAEKRGEAIDVDQLSCLLGVPVTSANARTGQGLDAVERMIENSLANPSYLAGLPWDKTAPGFNQAGYALAQASQTAVFEAESAENETTHPCGGTNCQPNSPSNRTLPTLVEGEVDEADRAAMIFDWIEKIETGLQEEKIEVPALSASDKVDRILLNPLAGTFVFMLAMYLVFWLANTFAAVFQDPLERLFDAVGGWDFTVPANLLKIPFTDIGIPGQDVVLFHAPSLADGLVAVLTALGWEGGILQGILVDGLLTGVGVVVSFSPLMIVMFAAIAVMEDSGYMARVAFLGDRLMRTIGLDGRVIMPFIVGFGCNLPTLAALRTVPDSRARMMAVVLTPYITCSARLIVYLFIAQVFFAEHATEVVWLMYFLSIVMVILGGLALRPIFMKGQKGAPLLLVLPAYQAPRAWVLARSAASRTWAFLKGAGKVIVVMTVVIWALMVTPVAGEGRFGDSLPANESAYGVVASAMAPVFVPAGFGDWHLTGSLVTGFVAKETMLGALAATYTNADVTESDVEAAEGSGEATPTMRELVQTTFEKSAGSAGAAPVAAFAFLLFVLTYTPCLATVAEQKRQLGWRRTLAAVGGQLAVAWVLAVTVFQIGKLFV